jgi:enamine deaminase RidA (YjgF/YER057c/UK114 family)
MILRIYKVDYRPNDGPIINDILKKNFGTDNPPASTWISVKGLANAGFLIEIEAQAVI